MMYKFGCLLLLLSYGCSAVSIARDMPQVQRNYKDMLLTRYSSNFPTEVYVNRMARNQAINEMIWLVDNEYREYEESLYSDNATFNTIVDLLALGMSATASVYGGEAIKAGLAAATAGVTGAKATIDKNYFLDKSRTALITSMQEMRARKLNDIEKGKHKKIEQYPMSQAMIDIQNYQNAGTLLSALQGITESSSKGLAQEQVQLMQIRSRTPDDEDD